MSEFLGSRISLISKSDIRYVGILHEINSEDSTVSLENVRSFGTEGRKGKPDEEIPPSSQVYEYIVFRGSDVKDLRIEEAPAASNEKPPAVPDDPAILGARPRPANGPTPSSQRGPPGPGGFGQNPYPNNFYPPPIGHWGRGGGPVPGPGGFGAMPFPPPGWSYPGQFPPGPGGPAPWNNNFGAFPPGPPGAPGASGAPSAPGPSGTPGAAGQINRPGSNVPGPEQKPAPIGAGADKKTGASGMQELPSEPKSLGQGPSQSQKPATPTPPMGTGSSAEESKATSTTLAATSKDSAAQPGHIPTGPSAPTGPKATRTAAAAVAIPVIPRTTPAGPSSTKPPGDAAGGPPTAAAIKDATQAAKAAVAMAMAKLDQGAGQQNGTATAMDNLTKKVNEMRVNAARGGVQSRGRGRGGRSAPTKVEVPDTDFDFASSNAKFNKEDLVKEASSSVPVSDSTNGADAAQFQASPTELPAYNKSRSFFDNISSESKERAENGGQKPGGREWRGEEQRRNIETFGQGSVDSGYRGYRGRGRGRGGARGRGYRGGGRGGFHRPRDNSAIAQ